MPPFQKNLSTVAGRIRYLIEDYSKGTVNQAAQGLEIPQATLVGIIGSRGQLPLVKHPKADVLRRIAEYYEVPLDWLVLGQGQAPDPDSAFAERFQWISIIRQLELGPEASSALWRLPEFTTEVAENLKNALSPSENKAHGERWTYAPEFENIYRKEIKVWILFFRELIDRLGLELVRDFVEANREQFVRGKSGMNSPRRKKRS